MSGVNRRRFLGLAGAAGALVTIEPLRGRGGRAHAQVAITHAQAGEAMIFLPLYVAQARGFFDQEGFSVTIFNAQQRTIALRAVIAGDAFSYSGDPAEAALARQRGIDVKNVGVLVNRAVGFIVAKPGMPKDAKQWKGKTIIVPRPPNTFFSLTQTVLQDAAYEQVDKDGLVWKPGDSTSEKDRVRLVPVVVTTELAALVAGEAELAQVQEPDVSNALAQGFEIVSAFADYYGPFFLSSVAVLNRTIQQKGDLVQRFVNALTRACLFGHKYPDRAAEVAVQRYYTLDGKVAAQAAQRIISTGAYPRDLRVTKEAYDNNFDKLLVRTGHPGARYPFAELMDLRFAEKAAAQIKDV